MVSNYFVSDHHSSRMTTPTAKPTSVAIVGAGLAGLTAARRLANHEIDTQVLEARERVGGRTFSRDSDTGRMVDLGAQWIGPGQDRIMALIDDLDIPTVEQYEAGKTRLHLSGELYDYRERAADLPAEIVTDYETALERLHEHSAAVPLDAPTKASRAAQWDSITVATWRDQVFETEPAKALFDATVRGYFAAEPRELSFLYFLFCIHASDGLERTIKSEPQRQVVGGAQRIATALADELDTPIALDTPVQAIKQDDGITLSTPETTIEARYAILTIPPALLD